jgi:hypothetical protein
MKCLSLFSIGLVVLVASSALSQEVRLNFDKAADFSKFKTYKWVPIPGGTHAAGLTDAQITAAFDSELATRSLTKVDTDSADLFVGYEFGVEKEQKISSIGPGWGGETWSGETSIISEGELVLDMYETAKHTLVWRGVASRTINLKAKPNDRQKHLVKVVQKLMENYPPRVMTGN